MFICFLIFASVGHFSLNRSDPQATEHAGIAMICFASFFIFGFATTWVSSLDTPFNNQPFSIPS